MFDIARKYSSIGSSADVYSHGRSVCVSCICGNNKYSPKYRSYMISLRLGFVANTYIGGMSTIVFRSCVFRDI